jgi:hypothetical protein
MTDYEVIMARCAQERVVMDQGAPDLSYGVDNRDFSDWEASEDWEQPIKFIPWTVVHKEPTIPWPEFIAKSKIREIINYIEENGGKILARIGDQIQWLDPTGVAHILSVPLLGCSIESLKDEVCYQTGKSPYERHRSRFKILGYE